VDESEIDSANETAAHGPPFRLWTTVVDARDRGQRSRRQSRHDLLAGIASDASAGRIAIQVAKQPSGGARKLSGVERGRLLVWLAVLVGLALIALAVVYWVEPAKSLPSWIPGHEAGSNHHHIKHGIAAFLLGVACLVFAWFRSAGPRPRSAAV